MSESVLHTCCALGIAILFLGNFDFFKHFLRRIVCGSKLLDEHKKKDRFRTAFFPSNPKDWYGITARSAVYVIHTYGVIVALRATSGQPCALVI